MTYLFNLKPSPRRWMNKKTQARMENIKKAQRLIKPQERGVAEQIEAKLKAGHHPITIARALKVSIEYVEKVKEAMARRVA